jgi:6-phosphogluconate dehydrogenase
VFAEWNKGDLDSYLIEITAEVLRRATPDRRSRWWT